MTSCCWYRAPTRYLPVAPPPARRFLVARPHLDRGAAATAVVVPILAALLGGAGAVIASYAIVSQQAPAASPADEAAFVPYGL